MELWEYAGYGEIRKHPGLIVRQITSLQDDYRNMRQKPPLSRRGTESFKKKEADFTSSLDLLFDNTVKSLQTSSLITVEDRVFLLHHLNKTISSTCDTTNHQKTPCEKRLAKQQKYQKFSHTHFSPKTPTTLDTEKNSESSSNLFLHSGEEFTP